MKAGRRFAKTVKMIVPCPHAFAVLGYAVFCFVAFAVVLEVASAAGFHIYHLLFWNRDIPKQYQALMSRCRARPGGRCESLEEAVASGNPLYDRYPWSEQYWREQNARHSWWWENLPAQPFVGWGNRRLSGTTLNVEAHDNGTWRRTIEPPRDCASMSSVTIWAFGGSTMFGDGSADEYTIPSLLARQLSERLGKCVHIVNMGVEEYNTNQEIVLLLRQLQVSPKPDAVIFYDGANDAFVALDESDTRVHGFAHAIAERLGPHALRSNLLLLLQGTYSYRLAAAVRERAAGAWRSAGPRNSPDAGAALDPSSEADEVLNRYESNLSVVRMYAREFGFRTYFFWQPLLLYSVPKGTGQSPYVQAILHPSLFENPIDRRYYLGVTRTFQEAERRAKKGEFQFLGHALDDANGLVYIDNTHIGPNGNQIIAEAMAKAIAGDPTWRNNCANTSCKHPRSSN